MKKLCKMVVKREIFRCCMCHTENVFGLESRNGKVYWYCKRCDAVCILTHSKWYIKTYGIDSTLDMLGVKC